MDTNSKKVFSISRSKKFMGRNNPNTKYKTLDDNFFKEIDSKEKAYLLGWIISDGSINKTGFTIAIHKKDFECLLLLKDIICSELPIKSYVKKDPIISFTVNSKIMVTDLCNLLQITPGKKSNIVQFPIGIIEEYKKYVLRGIFDGDGSISKPGSKKNTPLASIATNSVILQSQIKDFVNIRCYHKNSDINGCLEWSNNSALDFLSFIYSDIRQKNEKIFLRRKFDLYEDWAEWIPSLMGSGRKGVDNLFSCSKTDKRAVIPNKVRASDSGYDLTLIDIWKTQGNVTYYETGIKVQPAYGWYFMVVPRSSIAKSGYMLANSVGIIDRTYVGTIKVPLVKIDPLAPDLELPLKMVQIIPQPIIHFDIVEVDSFEETARGTGGFGSTGTK